MVANILGMSATLYKYAITGLSEQLNERKGCMKT
jgi:hypothetical protein